MKNVLLFSILCLIALNAQAQGSTNEYVDLGLPSKTLWKTTNESGFYTGYNNVREQFGDQLPSKAQWQELMDYCKWSWNGNVCRVTGKNGNYISLPAAGYFDDYDERIIGAGEAGFYWSSTDKNSGYAWYLFFGMDSKWDERGNEKEVFTVRWDTRGKSYHYSVRLIKNRK